MTSARSTSGEDPRCPSHPKVYFNAFAAVTGNRRVLPSKWWVPIAQCAMKPRVRYASETVATLGWHQLCTSVWLRPMWTPLHHVWVVQFEGRRSERMRGNSVKLCRGGGQLVAHSSELP
jgi:hypothetical protein